jgi:hypothetical protein
MPLTAITVIYGTGQLVGPDGTAATGKIVLQPVQETPSSSYTIVDRQITFPLVAGNISGTFNTNGQSGLQALVFEQLDGTQNPPPYVVAIPTSGTLDLSIVSRGTVGVLTPLYVPQSALAVPSGVATLGSDGILTLAQRPSAGAGTVTSVAAADGTIVIGGTPTVAPTARVGTIAQSQVTGLAAALAALVPTVRSAWIANVGDATLPNTAGVWVALAGFELDMPASVGQWVEIGVHAMRSNTSTAFLDIAVIKGASLVRFLSSGGATPGVEGDPGFYFSNNFTGQSAPRGFVVTSNDLDTGSVRFVVAVKATGSGTLYSSTNYPFYWSAKNLGVTN